MRCSGSGKRAADHVSETRGFEERRVPYIADAPGDGAFLAGGAGLVGLAVDAQVHDVVAADGAVVDDDVPRPQRDGVPL